jgi:hypothetical protein
LQGAAIVASDGEYLGKIASKYDGESVFNSYGTFGNKYSAKSIWNSYAEYGNQYSPKSPFNRYSSDPPRIVKDGVVIGYLSVNTSLASSVNPGALVACSQ